MAKNDAQYDENDDSLKSEEINLEESAKDSSSKEKTEVLNISDDEFEDMVIKSDIPVMVDFWAEWCGPCKMIAPIFAQVAEDYENKVKFVKINVDDNQSTPTKFGVRGIPTLMLFKDGALEATKVGAVTKTQLASFIDSNL